MAIFSFLTSSASFFLSRRSTEQYQGIGLALNLNYSLSSLVFLLVFLFKKLKGCSLARVMIILFFFLSSILFRSSSSILSYKLLSLTLLGTGFALNCLQSLTEFSGSYFFCRFFYRYSKLKGTGTVTLNYFLII